ncbi:MAG TPA: ABC transporter ATP-binding protein [Stellaceae bacterium]|nr:ABC transporter ATP-binding protein [Stellaceae bacterium]
MLELKALTAGYNDATILHGIDLSVAAGEIVALIGANGAGKSTLAKIIAGVLPPRQGEMRYEGKAIAHLSPRARIARGISLVPEGRQIIAGLSVEENLRLGAYPLEIEYGAVEQRIAAVCGQFPVLRERLRGSAGNLSGGQQQMLAIARALMTEPRLLVLDEPSLGLSPTLVTEVFALVQKLRMKGIGILLSEQNARMSLAIADRGYVLEMGRVALSGSGRELAANPAVVERYLGMGHAASAGTTADRATRHRQLVSGLGAILRD